MNETWIYRYTPESKRASSEWRRGGWKPAKASEDIITVSRQDPEMVMASVFWNTHGNLLIDFLPKLLDRWNYVIESMGWRNQTEKKWQGTKIMHRSTSRFTIQIASTPPPPPPPPIHQNRPHFTCTCYLSTYQHISKRCSRERDWPQNQKELLKIQWRIISKAKSFPE